MEKYKPIFDMTPEEIAEMNRVAIERQQELLQKIDTVRAKRAAGKNEDEALVITPLMREEAELREETLRTSLPDKE